jgi:hypothetical protein
MEEREKKRLCFGGAFDFLRLRFFVEWLARVWSGEGGLVATVPQDKRQSHRKHKTDQTGRHASGNGDCITGLLIKVQSSKLKAQAGCTGGHRGE